MLEGHGVLAQQLPQPVQGDLKTLARGIAFGVRP